MIQRSSLAFLSNAAMALNKGGRSEIFFDIIAQSVPSCVEGVDVVQHGTCYRKKACDIAEYFTELRDGTHKLRNSGCLGLRGSAEQLQTLGLGECYIMGWI